MNNMTQKKAFDLGRLYEIICKLKEIIKEDTPVTQIGKEIKLAKEDAKVRLFTDPTKRKKQPNIIGYVDIMTAENLSSN